MRNTLLLLTAAVTLTACAARQPACENNLRRLERQEAEIRHLFVLLTYRQGPQGMHLEIGKPAVEPGGPPLLLDAPNLAGRVEILDRQAKVLWKMGYEPGTETLRLRLPYPKGAERVRVTEPARGLLAEAAIPAR
jgi:hypothetical protein